MLPDNPQTILELAQRVKAIGNEGLVKEFSTIPLRNPSSSDFSAAEKVPSNVKRNRHPYSTMYDENRVVLSCKTGEGESASDFINASFVDGYKQKNAFIAAQGPLPSTCGDFWQMIWDQRCLIIVMLTGVVEGGAVKCHQYWEPAEGASAVHGSFEITTIGVESNEDYLVSSLKLKNLQSGDIRKVSHFFYNTWPDFKVPTSSKGLRKFVHHVRQTQATMVDMLDVPWTGHPKGPPIVTHCSAGLGRTGVFIVLDISIFRLEAEGTISIREELLSLRNQRPLSIGMPSQYVFCYRVLIEYALDHKLLSIDIDLKELEDNERFDEVGHQKRIAFEQKHKKLQ